MYFQEMWLRFSSILQIFTYMKCSFSSSAGVPLPLSIPTSINLEAGESNAKNLVTGLSFLNPSQQCQEAITPFLCIFIFNLCDFNNTLHTILREDCLHIRDNVCVSEWRLARQFLGVEFCLFVKTYQISLRTAC